jgi:BirA family transcriptional regulator, biotin operon repressor / biotin---[acetyl-CoA-carboxylase] ligase
MNSFNKKIHSFRSTDSTNNEAIRRAREGGGEGEVFIADHQTAGRGRSGRHWESPPGKNLYLSLLLRPECSPQQAALLTLVAGTSIHEALSPFLPEDFQESLKIKWPNDIYLGDKKIAGVLTEMESKGEKVAWVVCGMGINLNTDSSDFSLPLQETATSLKVATGSEIDKDQVVLRLLETFQDKYFQFLKNGPSETISYCNRHSYLRNKSITWEDQSQKRRGKALDISPTGRLEVECDHGGRREIFSGEVHMEVL